MSKKELLNSIGKLEKRLDKAEDSMSLVSDMEQRGAKVEGQYIATSLVLAFKFLNLTITQIIYLLFLIVVFR